MTVNELLLEVAYLKTYFFTDQGTVRAVDGIDFAINKKETLGVVGESGCGKSVTALSIMRLLQEPPGRIVAGQIRFDGHDLIKLNNIEMRQIRGNKISMIFQEPMTSLNPVLSIGDQIAEGVQFHERLSKKAALRKAVDMLKTVGIPSPEQRIKEYPHQMSGGMRQRAMIAMALSCNPSLLIADEPTTALDVTVQAQILDLMNKLKEEFQTAIMLITHDLGVIAETAQNVIVMYAGKVVECGGVEVLFEEPLHPYTRGLLSSIPDEQAIKTKKKLQEIPGIVPNLVDIPPGCLFHPRCSRKIDICIKESPLFFIPKENHKVACWLYDTR